MRTKVASVQNMFPRTTVISSFRHFAKSGHPGKPFPFFFHTSQEP